MQYITVFFSVQVFRLQGGASCAVTAKGWEWAQAQRSLVLEQVLLGQAGVWARMGPCDKQALVQRMAAPHPARYNPSAVKRKSDVSLLGAHASSNIQMDGKGEMKSVLEMGLGGSLGMHASSSSGLAAWGLGAHVAFCGDGANDAGALKVSPAKPLCHAPSR